MRELLVSLRDDLMCIGEMMLDEKANYRDIFYAYKAIMKRNKQATEYMYKLWIHESIHNRDFYKVLAHLLDSTARCRRGSEMYKLNVACSQASCRVHVKWLTETIAKL